MGSLVRLVLLLSSLALVSCQSRQVTTLSDAGRLSEKDGITYVDNKPAQGRVVLLPANSDTLLDVAFTDGLKHGSFRKWYTNGKLAEVREFRNGRNTGVHLGWYENGTRRFIYHFKDDLYEGEVSEWDMNGNPYRVFHYVNGKEEGLQRMWEADGRLKANYVVRNGRKYGLAGTKNCETAVLPVSKP